MATSIEVKQDMKDQLTADNSQAMNRFGASWINQDIGDFYDTANGTDLAMKNIMQNRILAREGKTLSNTFYKQLADQINRNTSVKKAIETLRDISDFAQ